MNANLELIELDHYLDNNNIFNFSAKELSLKLHDGSIIVPPKELWKNIIPTAKLAESIRIKWNGPLRVVCGYRDEKRNQGKGQSPNSRHLHFQAIDIQPSNSLNKKIFEEFEKIVKYEVELFIKHGEQVGLGIYPGDNNLFCHIDVGFKTRNWVG